MYRDPVAVDTGSMRADVRARMGEPEQVREFKLPEGPFFGPQESLAGLVPAGTLVEEWVYRVGNDELYVWFAGAEGEAKDQWRVLETARYPAGAVY
ncbi:MAG TPA: hypothetical protein VFG95_08555 [Nitrospiria bacterium]|nr:hypothetical protein [Nitrospiria bacterium]